MRHRERDSRLTTPTTMTRTRLTHSTGITTVAQVAYQNGPFTYGKFEAMDDIVTPGYHTKSSRGEVIMNPMVQSYWTRTMTPGGFSFKNKGTGSNDFTDTYDGYYAIDRKGGPNGHLPVSLAPRELAVQAGTSAMANIEKPDFEGLVFAAELRETLSFLRNPVQGYVNWLHWRNTRYTNRNNRTLRDFISENWLSYRYGMRPLYNDAQKFLNALNESGKRRPLRRTARGFASDTSSAAASYRATTYEANVQVDSNTTRTYKVRSGVLYEITSTLKNSNYGFSESDILPALWEATTFSFIADWFANIGTYLRTVVPHVEVKVLGSWTKSEDVQSTNTTAYIADLDDVNDTLLNSGMCSEFFATKTTTRVPTVSVGLTANSANLNLVKLGGDKILDLLTIAHQLLNSRGR